MIVEKNPWQDFFNLQPEDGLAQLRQEKFAKFMKSGLPTTRGEEWKYTPPPSFDKHCFELAPKRQECISTIQPFLLANLPWRMVFIDGHFQADLSLIPNDKHIVVTNLAQAIIHHKDLIQQHLSLQRDAAFANLNTAFMQDGAFIYFPVQATCRDPIHLLFLNSDYQEKTLQTIRNIIIVDEKVQATFLEEHGSLAQTPYMVNFYTQLFVGSDSQISYIKLQNQHANSFHIANFEIRQKQDSRVNAFLYHLGGELAREDLHAYLNEQGATLSLNGIFLPFKKQHIDVHTAIHHLADHTESDTLFKGVVASKSRAVFNGKIVVESNIKKAVANLQNKNLLLAPDAEVNTKPELEIYSDDVKCKHGAATGNLDQQMLFYMRSRGIDKESAYQLLLLAFIHEQININAQNMISEKILTCITQHYEDVIK
jgi:Fe-S cluster assembly protein SufD